MMTEQSTNRGDVDHSTFTLRKKRLACNGFGEQEHTGDVEVENLVPPSKWILFGRSSPGRTGIVDQDIDPAELHHDPLDDSVHRIGTAEIRDKGICRNSKRRKMSNGLVELRFFARDEHDRGTIFTESLGRLEPETARTAID